MTSSDNPYAPSPIRAATEDDPLARVPKAPRVPPRAAETAILGYQPVDRSNRRFGILWTTVMTLATLVGIYEVILDPLRNAGALALVPFLLAGVLLLVGTHRKVRGRRDAFVSGVATLGTVASFREDKVGTTLTWAFVDGHAVSFTGKLTTKHPRLLGERALPPGSRLVVLYDPANPKRNTLWIE